MSDLFSFDYSFLESSSWVVGVDEVGRGPLAGPVTACAFAISKEWLLQNRNDSRWSQVNDSKKLTETQREDIYQSVLYENEYAGWGIDFEIATASVREIDEVNILEATKLAMYRALSNLEKKYVFKDFLFSRGGAGGMFELGVEPTESPQVPILVDGRPLKDFPYIHRSFVKGDGKSFCIAMASIMAKVDRDSWMVDCGTDYPEFAWAKNKGYGTQQHRDALSRVGATVHHRKSFLTKLEVASPSTEP